MNQSGAMSTTRMVFETIFCGAGAVSTRLLHPDLDIQRLHRFLVEHGTEGTDGETDCVACGAMLAEPRSQEHYHGCEWVALVEMTKP